MRRYADLAALLPADVERIGKLLGLDRRMTQENWIEQAQILSKGGQTDYARRMLQQRVAAPVAAAPAAPKPAAPAAPASPAQAAAPAAPKPAVPAAPASPAPAAAPAAPTPAAAAPAPAAPAPAPAAAPAAASAAGSVAATAAAVAAAAAARVAAEAETRPAKLADAIRDHAAAKPAAPAAPAAPRADLSGLRSVRSEGLRGGDTGPAAPVDDLKRIRGIGVLIEKKLNSLGITSYDQVANWTSNDIDRISQLLDFKGRIERENWIEQARILASGGQTEFSRRVDRGEVDSSRTPGKA